LHVADLLEPRSLPRQLEPRPLALLAAHLRIADLLEPA